MADLSATPPPVAPAGAPLAPGDSITLTTPFHVKLPKNFSRGGHHGNQYTITQWYPKPAVYDKTGWHAMPYLDQGEWGDQRQRWLLFDPRQQVAIRVQTEQALPVDGVEITIRTVGNSGRVAGALRGDPPLKLVTGADGQVFFLPGFDAPITATDFEVQVQAPGQDAVSTGTFSRHQTPWSVTLPEARTQRPGRLDLALVIDTTGSMGDELEYLKLEIDQIAAGIQQTFPEIDQRYSLILYRDEGDEYVLRSFDFTGSLPEFRRVLAAQSAAGGGDNPEAMHLALEQSLQLSWRGAGTARVVFLVTDAPPHPRFVQRTLAAANSLRARGVSVFPVGASGLNREAEFILRAVGYLTQGQYLFLTDHSGIGSSHLTPQDSSYHVERLDQLMIRLVAEKLTGQGSTPQDVIAVSEPDSDVHTSLPTCSQSSDEDVLPLPRTDRSVWDGTWLRQAAALGGLLVLLALAERRPWL